MKVVPFPMDDPPVKAPYQLSVPADAVAPSVITPVLHRLAGVVPLIVGIALTVAITAVLAGVVHPFAVAFA